MAEQGMARGARKGKHLGAFRVVTQYGDLVMRYSWAWVYGNVTQYMGHGAEAVSSSPRPTGGSFFRLPLVLFGLHSAEPSAGENDARNGCRVS